jgi:hypothetical protein
MRTDSPAAIMGSLGLIEDEMAAMLVEYAEAAGFMAWYELWHREVYLKLRERLKSADTWPPGTTETAKKDDITWLLISEYPDVVEQAKDAARRKAIGDKLFAGLDARRSIGQTLMKPHLATEPQFGSGASYPSADGAG